LAIGASCRFVRGLRQVERLAELVEQIHAGLLIEGGEPSEVGSVDEGGPEDPGHGAVGRVVDRGRDVPVGVIGDEGAAGAGPFDLAPDAVLAGLQCDDPAARRRRLPGGRGDVDSVVFVDRQPVAGGQAL
jgi:hypothetical protein